MIDHSDPSRRALLAALAGAALAAPATAKGKKGKKAKPPLVTAVVHVTRLDIIFGNGEYFLSVSMSATTFSIDGQDFFENPDVGVLLPLGGAAAQVRAALVRDIQEKMAAEYDIEPARVDVLLV